MYHTAHLLEEVHACGDPGLQRIREGSVAVIRCCLVE